MGIRGRRKNMSAAIFFGGLVVGFLSGWVFMALLTMVSNRNQRDLVEALAYFQITPRQESEPVKLLGE
jgi:fructose-specific phosphotransferase system IIC component